MASQIDYDGFSRAVQAVRKDLLASLGERDLKHLRMVERRGRLLSLIGYATAWIFPNPISAALISHGILTRWLLMHHISHRGYDKVPGVPPRYTSKVFATGWRRVIDWFDWMVPAAWAHEHNVLHHYHTGDRDDPDMAERNMRFIRRSRAPMWRRYLQVAVIAATWKFAYYAPSTLRALQDERRRHRGEPPAPGSFIRLLNPFHEDGREFYWRCILPYGLVRFVLLPTAFLPLGGSAALSVLLTSLLAELMTNVHAFVVIGPNHTGDDLFRFEEECKDKREFYARQVLGSVNYRTGSEAIDWSQAYLNYQIEHHLWPDLPMLKYREVQPRAKALITSFGLPYLQEPVFRRVKKMVAVMVGASSMRHTRRVTADDVATAGSERGEAQVVVALPAHALPDRREWVSEQ